jgi:NCS1 family nucleobase:cation symporter-1
VLESISSRITINTAKRIGMTIAYALLAMFAAIFGKDDFLVIFKDFVFILLYVLIPWSAINLADYFILRKGHYNVEDMFRRDGGEYGKWDAIGLGSYAVGLVVQVPFMVTTLYTGPLAEPLGFVDIAWIFGFIVPAVVYVLWKRARIAVPVATP